MKHTTYQCDVCEHTILGGEPERRAYVFMARCCNTKDGEGADRLVWTEPPGGSGHCLDDFHAEHVCSGCLSLLAKCWRAMMRGLHKDAATERACPIPNQGVPINGGA